MDNIFFDSNCTILDSNAKTQDQAFQEIADLSEKLKISDSSKATKDGLIAREKEVTTGFEDGFAIPHARVKAILKPSIVFMRFKNGIEWKSLDGSKVKVAICLLIPEDKSSSIHLTLLSNISRRLISKEVRDQLRNAKNHDEIKETLLSEYKEVKNDDNVKKLNKKIVGITACPVGVAHTYMAADKLTETGQKLGYDIKIETHGSSGVGNEIKPNEIKEADVVIIAADIGVDCSKFVGKKIFKARVSDAIKNPEKLIEDAFAKGKVTEKSEDDDSDDIFKTNGSKQGIMQHLMSGVSYMVPLVILGGIFIALSIGLTKSIYGPDANPDTLPQTNILYYLFWIGSASFTLMIPILGAFIANSIAGRAAIAPALVVSFIGNTPAAFYPIGGITVTTPTGFIGAIAAGLACGYTVKWINDTWKVPKGMRPIMPIFVIPILVGSVYSLIMMFVIGAPIGWVMEQFSNWIGDTWGNTDNASNVAISLGFGLLIGAMAGFDMGGPINKVAFLTCVGLISNHIYTPMGAMACAIPVAPLGMGMATWIFRPLFSQEQKVMGSTAFGMGCIGISEGAIPFAVNDPKRVIPSNIVGSAIAGGIAGVAGIADIAGHGGPIVCFLSAVGHGNGNTGQYGWGDAWTWTLLALLIMFIGATITALMYGFWLLYDKKRNGEDISLKKFDVKRKKGEGTLETIKNSKKVEKEKVESTTSKILFNNYYLNKIYKSNFNIYRH
ncbi:fructose-specific PTS transporter subunit EIIC [Spiroplasma endosymbiont of Amphibalanus improvisus]|uniref:PTS fructose transporter subunit IIABC n=1 Tax=Spiroplasma endosymbiont of Amphibalanus improvisus TaxID=3066327 RepID=UPI00313C0CF1